MNPIIIAQVDTPGSATAVSCTSDYIAVADAASGLVIIDVRDPPNAGIHKQISINQLGGGTAQAVVAFGDLGFVGTTNGNISMVDVEQGIILAAIETGGRVEDLAISREYLYAYAAGQLMILDYLNGPLSVIGSVNSPGGINSNHGRGGLFVGGEVAYLVHRQGYNTFDISDPTQPSVIATGNTPQFGWKNIVVNDFGDGFAAVSPNGAFDGPHDTHRYDVSDPEMTNKFEDTLVTPGVARDLTIYNGLLYVADHTAGLQVINYKEYDSQKTAPTGSLTTSSVDGTVIEGSLLLLTAEVKDDFQVRNVEFYADEDQVAVDGNFPFEFLYRVPAGNVGNAITFTGIVRDTGGNRLDIGPVSLEVIEDNVSPVLTVNSVVNDLGSTSIFVGDTISVDVGIFDNVAPDSDSLRFFINDVEAEAVRSSGNIWLIQAPTTKGTYSLTISMKDFAGNPGVTDPIELRIQAEAISRAVSVFNFADNIGKRDAVSRAISIYNFANEKQRDAVSRAISVYNFSVNKESKDAISRAVSLYNFADNDPKDAVSRAVSVKNE